MRRRLVNESDGAGLERGNGDVAAIVGHRHNHDAGQGCDGERRECPKEADAIEVRHDQVERHDVRLELRSLLERIETVAGDADDHEP